MSAALQRGTRRATLPVAGFITSPCRAADARWRLPAIHRSTVPASTGLLIVCSCTTHGRSAPRAPAGRVARSTRPAGGATACRRRPSTPAGAPPRSEEHTSELQSRLHLVCRLLLEKKKDY